MTPRRLLYSIAGAVFLVGIVAALAIPNGCAGARFNGFCSPYLTDHRIALRIGVALVGVIVALSILYFGTRETPSP